MEASDGDRRKLLLPLLEEDVAAAAAGPVPQDDPDVVVGSVSDNDCSAPDPNAPRLMIAAVVAADGVVGKDPVEAEVDDAAAAAAGSSAETGDRDVLSMLLLMRRHRHQHEHATSSWDGEGKCCMSVSLVAHHSSSCRLLASLDDDNDAV